MLWVSCGMSSSEDIVSWTWGGPGDNCADKDETNNNIREGVGAYSVVWHGLDWSQVTTKGIDHDPLLSKSSSRAATVVAHDVALFLCCFIFLHLLFFSSLATFGSCELWKVEFVFPWCLDGSNIHHTCMWFVKEPENQFTIVKSLISTLV